MLIFEISLIRFFAIQQFHHFGFIVISLAVLGISASGLVLSITRLQIRVAIVALCFAGSILLSYLVMNSIPFDSYSIAWDPRQYGTLSLYFLAAGLPFFFAGWVIGASLASAGIGSYLPYAANLIGSAMGCLVAFICIATLGIEGAIVVAVCLGLVATVILGFNPIFRAFVILLVIGFLGMLLIKPNFLEQTFSQYKPFAIAVLNKEARHSYAGNGFTARIDVVESSSIHTYPGLGLFTSGDVPGQAAVFIDGEGPLPITNLSLQEARRLPLITRMPSSLAYRLRPDASALLIQADTGLNAIIALGSGASVVTIPVDEPALADLLRNNYAEYSHDLFIQGDVIVENRSSRSVLNDSNHVFDVIEYTLTDSYYPVTSGAFSLTENFILTVDSFKEAYQRLSENGLIIITRWLGTPPSESARAWATLIKALEESGVDQPAEHLIAFRGMRTGTMIFTRNPLDANDLRLTREFLSQAGFDPVYLPDLMPDEINQHNRLPAPVYMSLFSNLLMDSEASIQTYPFNIRPPTDVRPYFNHYFRWRQMPEILNSLGETWQPFGGSGYLILILLFGLMLVLAAILILIPSLLVRFDKDRSSPNFATLMYFGCLGAGYLFVELFLIQRLSLYLDHPATAFAVTLFTLLLASGVGSLISPRIPTRFGIVGILVLLVFSSFMIPIIIEVTLFSPLIIRIILTVLTLFPLGVLMGVPFAAGMGRLEMLVPGLIPWAWAVNGAISGLSGVLVAMIALDLGFQAVFVVGALAYFGAFLTFKRIGVSKSTEKIAST